jgi:hypothetical protein
MESSFSSTISSWHDFYMLAGTASATLIGLLFVAASLHLDLIGEAGAATILSLARRTFTRFIMVVVIALTFLVPRQDPEGLGLPLLALGLVEALRTLRVGRDVVTPLKEHTGVLEGLYHMLLPVILPLASSVGLIVVAATILSGTTAYLYWMVPIVAILLTNAATNAWDLMLGLARYKLRPTGTALSSTAAPGDEEEKDDRWKRMMGGIVTPMDE